jgi:hypothetical protein
MQVLVIIDWAGVTEEQYDAARNLINLNLGGDVPKGGMFHVSAITDEGARVVDIWESAEEFQAFFDDHVMPSAQELSIEGEPRVEIYPVHTLFMPMLELSNK